MDASAAKRRWFWPTPAWFVYGAAATTCVLFAAERWRWFPVHYQKGWPVLLAVAVVAAVFILLPAWMLVGLVFRRRVQFGLRTMLVFVTLCAVVCSWLAVRLREARRQADAVAAIREKLGGTVVYNWQIDNAGKYMPDEVPPRPDALRRLLGVDFFDPVIGSWLDTAQVTDAGLAHVVGLAQLQWLWVVSDKVTDAGLSRLDGLTNLRHLYLRNNNVTEEDVKKLKRVLPNCKIAVYRDSD